MDRGGQAAVAPAPRAQGGERARPVGPAPAAPRGRRRGRPGPRPRPGRVARTSRRTDPPVRGAGTASSWSRSRRPSSTTSSGSRTTTAARARPPPDAARLSTPARRVRPAIRTDVRIGRIPGADRGPPGCRLAAATAITGPGPTGRRPSRDARSGRLEVDRRCTPLSSARSRRRIATHASWTGSRSSDVALTFRGDNDTHHVSLDAGQWHCTCHYFESWGSCVHLLTLQKIFGVMLPEDAQTSIFSATAAAALA